MTSEDGAARPHLRVVSGDPSPEELAIATAVLTALASAPTAETAPRWSRWSDPAAGMRRPVRQGPGGWRASAGLR